MTQGGHGGGWNDTTSIDKGISYYASKVSLDIEMAAGNNVMGDKSFANGAVFFGLVPRTCKKLV